MSAPDDGTQGIALLTAGFAFLGIACFLVAVTLGVRLWLRITLRAPRQG